MRYPAFTGDEPCTQFDPDMYYPNPTEANEREYLAVRALCRQCPMQGPCLEWGMRHESYGTWGGYSMNAIERLRQQHGIRLSAAVGIHYVVGDRRAS